MTVATTRTILITGGSNGIGRAIAKHFSGHHEDVTVWGRNEQRLKSLAQETNGSITAEVVDVTDPRQIKAAIESLIIRCGYIDVLICAAGYPKPITTKTDYQTAMDLWKELLDVNLTGSFATVMAASPHLTRPGARIILVGSSAAHTGSVLPGGIGYAAAKAGLSGLTFALARELGPDGITVNLVVPGFIKETGITADWPDVTTKPVIEQTPAGRAGTPQDMASAVASLTSPEAGFITGQILQVNGGMLMGR